MMRAVRPLRLVAGCPEAMDGWRFTQHARARVNARGFDPHEVVRACESPEICTTAYDYGHDRFRYVRGKVVVIAVPDTAEIVTVLLRSYQQWNDTEARKAMGF